MVDDSTRIVSNLSEICTTVYDQWVSDTIAMPCISYIETSNVGQVVNSQLKYSTVQYQVKLWCKTRAEIATKSSSIDDKMYQLGYRLIGSNELIYIDRICKTMTYECTGIQY